MSNVKSNIINLIKVICFVILFVIIFIALTYVFAGDGAKAENGYEKRISYAYRGEEPNSLDVVFFGNSDVYRGISPVDLYKNNKIKSAVAGNPGVTLDKMYADVEDMFKYQKPKVVVLETDCVFNGHSFAKKKVVTTLKGGEKNAKVALNPYGKVKSTLLNADSAILSGLNYQMPLIKYHDKWKEFKLSNLKDAKRTYYTFPNKGMVYSRTSRAFDDSIFDYMEGDGVTVAKMEEKDKVAFKKIYEKCQKENAQLVLITIPSATSWTYDKSDQVKELAKKYNLEYYDYNLDYPAHFSWAKHSKDGGNHLNYKGAKIVTKEIGNILADKL